MSNQALRKNVLILDGDADCNSLFDSFFMHVGYSSIYVENEDSALEEIKKTPLSLILVVLRGVAGRRVPFCLVRRRRRCRLRSCVRRR